MTSDLDEASPRVKTRSSGLEEDEAKTLEKLRSLFHLLDPENSSSSNMTGKHQDTLDFLAQCSRRVSVYYHNSKPMGKKCSFYTVIPRFMQLLRESVLSHQWPEALKLVMTLTSVVKGTDVAVWKVGLACLTQDKERNSRLVEQFVKHVYLLKKLTVVEVLLEYLLFLLTQSDTRDAKLLVQELKKNQGHNLVRTEKRTMAHNLFFAYQGLALYAEWKMATFRADTDENDIEFISQMLSQGSADRMAKTTADAAIEYLLMVKDVPGVWDIFITRLTEIYEYYGNIEESRKVLMSYSDRNPRNPNAYRYLYEFECNYGGDETMMIQCLQNIIRMDPCNALCLKLFTLKEKNDPTAVSLLFDYLDYTHCSEHEEVWAILADILTNISSSDVEEVVMKCWNVRKDWWPSMIFKDLDPVCHSTQKSEPNTLLRNKQLVQEALLRIEDSFVDRKRIRVPECETDIEPSAKRRRKQNTQVSLKMD